MAEENKSVQNELKQRFINSIALAVNVTPDEVKHIQVVITADEDNKLHCYFDVIDPSMVPKFAE